MALDAVALARENALINSVQTAKLEILPFDGKEYHIWVAKTTRTLRARDMFRFVDPDDNVELDENDRLDAARYRALDAALWTALESDALALVSALLDPTPRQVWALLRATYGRLTIARRITLQNKMAEVKQGKNETIQAYLIRLGDINRELRLP